MNDGLGESPCDGCGRAAFEIDGIALCDSCATDATCSVCGDLCGSTRCAVCSPRPVSSGRERREAVYREIADALAWHTDLDDACAIAFGLTGTLSTGDEDPVAASLEALRPLFGVRDARTEKWAEVAEQIAACWTEHVALVPAVLPGPPRLPTPVPDAWRFGVLPDHRIDETSATVRPGVAA